jgi:hypothetical protein
VPRDMGAELRRLRAQLVGGEPSGLGRSYLQQPNGDRPLWAGTGVPALGARQFTRSPSGLLVPAGAATGPAPIDSLLCYLTAPEVLGFSLVPEQVDAALAAAPCDDFVQLAASILGRLEGNGFANRELQRGLTTEFFEQPLRSRILTFIANGHLPFAPQILLMVMKAALLASPEGPATQFNGGNVEPFFVTMFGIAQWLGSEPTAATASWGDYPEWISLEMVRNQHFNADSNRGSILARYQRLWRELPAELATTPDAIDVGAVFEQVTGVTLDELLATGFPLMAQASEGVVRFTSSYYDGTALPPDRREAALRLLVADQATMRASLRDEVEAGGFEWGFTTFRRFPVLQTTGGDLIVLSTKYLLERIAGGAAYWELHEHFRRDGKRALLGHSNFHGRVVERYVRDSVEALVGRLPGDARRIWDEDDQRAAWGDDSKVCDLLVDYGWAWVCIEVVSGRLTQKSLALGSSADLDRDVDKLVEDKLAQLDAAISNLRRDEQVLTGRAPAPGKRYFPVVLAGYGFPVNPLTMSVIRQRAADAGVLQRPDIGPVEVLDFDMLEQVEAAVEDGGPSLAELLAAKPTANLRLAALDQYLALERGLRLRRPDRLTPTLHTVFGRITALHGLATPSPDEPGRGGS